MPSVPSTVVAAWCWRGLEWQRCAWTMKVEMRTPRYTTQVDELPVAQARRVTFRLRSGPMLHYSPGSATGQEFAPACSAVRHLQTFALVRRQVRCGCVSSLGCGSVASERSDLGTTAGPATKPSTRSKSPEYSRFRPRAGDVRPAGHQPILRRGFADIIMRFAAS